MNTALKLLIKMEQKWNIMQILEFHSMFIDFRRKKNIFPLTIINIKLNLFSLFLIWSNENITINDAQTLKFAQCTENEVEKKRYEMKMEFDRCGCTFVSSLADLVHLSACIFFLSFFSVCSTEAAYSIKHTHTFNDIRHFWYCSMSHCLRMCRNMNKYSNFFFSLPLCLAYSINSTIIIFIQTFDAPHIFPFVLSIDTKRWQKKKSNKMHNFQKKLYLTHVKERYRIFTGAYEKSGTFYI